jgi:hypothetical protein
MLRIYIALKSPSSRPGLNPRTLGPVASTLAVRWEDTATVEPAVMVSGCRLDLRLIHTVGQDTIRSF